MLVTHSVCLQDELGRTEQLSVASQNGDKEAPSTGNVGQFLTPTITDNRPVSSPKAQTFDFDGPYLRLPPVSFPSDVWKNREVTSSELKARSTCLENVGLPHCLASQQLPGKKGMPPSFSTIHEYEDEKQLPFARQNGSQSSQLEKEGNSGGKLQNVAGTNGPCRNGSLNYIAVEDLAISKDLGSLLLLPATVSKEGRPACDSRTTGTTETTEELSSLEVLKKEPETVLPVHSQSLAAPLAASQRRFDDYVTALPAPPGFAPKEGLAFSTDEPKPDKVFLIFHHPGSHSPVLLSQVGEYCFFPGSKPAKEACKSQEERRGCQLPQASPKVEKCPSEKKVDSNMLQSPIAFAEI